MNPIIQLLRDSNIDESKIKEIFTTLTENPLAAMATISQLGIAPEKLQPVMMMAMQNPQIIRQAVEELGLDVTALDNAKEKLSQ